MSIGIAIVASITGFQLINQETVLENELEKQKTVEDVSTKSEAVFGPQNLNIDGETKIENVENIITAIDVKGKNLIKLQSEALFDIYAIEDEFKFNRGEKVWNFFIIGLDPEKIKTYQKIGYTNEPPNVAVILPILTSTAYQQNGFSSYFQGICDESCLTLKLADGIGYESSGNAVQVLTLLGYNIINDLTVDKNPDILKKFDKIILLHNEYVTQKEFDAIMNHPNVVYLYPNALHAEVSVDYENDEITFVKGYGYPEENIDNAFEWKFDNSDQKNNFECIDMKFQRIDNGFLLNCYPEKAILISEDLLLKIKAF